MITQGFSLFATAIGSCGIAWSERGITGVQLPEGTARATRARLQQRFEAAPEALPPAPVAQAVADIVHLLNGARPDLAGAELDLDDVLAFEARVYHIARSIAPGDTLTYGDIAKRLGAPGAARAVGRALGRNPFPIIVPCHRVLAAGGKVGGFSAHGGVATKLELLNIERARLTSDPQLFDHLPLAVAPAARPSP